MQNIFEIISFDRLLRIKELEEFLHELWCHVNFERSDLDCLVDNELEEELIDSLQMWPCWINFIFGFNTSFRELEIGFLDVWQWSEDVLLNHGHNIIEMRNDYAHYSLLILQKLLDLVNRI